MATPATISRRTVLAAPLVLTGMTATPALATTEGSGPALLQAFLDTLSPHDLKAFRTLYR